MLPSPRSRTEVTVSGGTTHHRRLHDLAERLVAEHAGVVHPGRVHALVHQADRLLCVRDEHGEHRLDEVAAVVRRLLLREVASRSRRRA